MRQGALDANTFVRLPAAACPLEQEAGQLFRNRMRQSERTNHVIRALTILSKVLGRVQASIGVAL